MVQVSIVIPVYNEEPVLNTFYKQLSSVISGLGCSCEVIFVDDGSTDHTLYILDELKKTDPSVRVISLSRNFGHQAAICAGMEASRGKYTSTMDGDGQHPPELIAQMTALADAGYDIVMTQRMDQVANHSFKSVTSRMFYKVINRVGDTKTIPGGADFRLLNRKALDSLIAMPEYHRFLRGMVSWIGFRSVILPFTPNERIAGKSKYTLGKMFRLASDAIFSFSMLPLYIGLSAGAFFLILALIEAVYVLSFWISGNTSHLAPGWSSLMFMLLIIGAVLMIILGFTGVYIGYIFQEVKHRPVYIIKRDDAEFPVSEMEERK